MSPRSLLLSQSAVSSYNHLHDHGTYLTIEEKPNNFGFHGQVKDSFAKKGVLAGFFQV